MNIVNKHPLLLASLSALLDFSIWAVHRPACNIEAPGCLHSANDVISEGRHGRQNAASLGEWWELVEDQRNGRFTH